MPRITIHVIHGSSASFWVVLIIAAIVISPFAAIYAAIQDQQNRNKVASVEAKASAFDTDGTRYPANTAQRSGKVVEFPEDHSVAITNGSLTFNSVTASVTGDYYLTTVQTIWKLSDGSTPEIVDVTVNGQAASKLNMFEDISASDCSNIYCEPYSIRIHLHSGQNTIVLSRKYVCPDNYLSCDAGLPILAIVLLSNNDKGLTSPQN